MFRFNFYLIQIREDGKGKVFPSTSATEDQDICISQRLALYLQGEEVFTVVQFHKEKLANNNIDGLGMVKLIN